MAVVTLIGALFQGNIAYDLRHILPIVACLFFFVFGGVLLFSMTSSFMTRGWIVLEPDRLIRYRVLFGRRRRHVLALGDIAAIEHVKWTSRRRPEPQGWMLRLRLKGGSDGLPRWVKILDFDKAPDRSAWLGALLEQWSGLPLNVMNGGNRPSEIVGTE